MNSFRPSHYFHCFTSDVSTLDLPKKFTFPFCYEPHELAKIAAAQLQHYLDTQQEWQHNFGLVEGLPGNPIGKMFGVLVARSREGTLGYFAAVSGKLAGSNANSYFVPPIFDMLTKDSFFLQEEQRINALNREIDLLETSLELRELKMSVAETTAKWQHEHSALKTTLREKKKARKQMRLTLHPTRSESDYELLMEDMKAQSLADTQTLQRFQHRMDAALTSVTDAFNAFQHQIDSCKKERKERSANLQQRLFAQYNFLNAHGDSKNVVDVFNDFNSTVPPAGSGECAAPKLLQHAYVHGYQPLALAEFWWGISPLSEVRRHKNYYPACRKKCEPILSFMLEGLPVDDNPMLQENTLQVALPTLHEDEDIIVFDKPAEFLSVPGIHVKDSVYTRVLQLYPNAGPIIIHRLDMSTSGILIVAKNKEAHRFIQQQFIQHTIKKEYIALLDGIIDTESGRIELPLRVDLDDRPRQMVCFQYGKPAATRWQKIGIENGKTRVRFFPETGRTHQLRMHAAHHDGLNTPIVGDDLYGKRSQRLHLHARAITFVHPRTGQEITFISEPAF